MTENEKLIDNVVIDSLNGLLTDRDREIGYLKGLVSNYFYWQERFEEDFNDISYNKLVEAEERLRSYVKKNLWLQQEI